MSDEKKLPIIYGIGNCMTDFFVHLQDKDASFLGYKEASVNHVDASAMQSLLAKLAPYKPLAFTGGTTVNILKTIARHANILPAKLFLTGTIGKSQAGTIGAIKAGSIGSNQDGTKDELGANFEKHISKKGITSFLRTADEPSGVFVKIVPQNKKPILVASPSCARNILPSQIDKNLCKLANFVIVEGMLLQNKNTFDTVVAHCNAYHTPLVIDCASPFGAKLLAPILQSLMQKDFSLIIFANEDETEILCNADIACARICKTATGTEADGACVGTGTSAQNFCGANCASGATGVPQNVCNGLQSALNLASPYCTIFVAKKSGAGATVHYSARTNNLHGKNLHGANLQENLHGANFLLHKTPAHVLANPFDATGAGDAFAGAFLLALLGAQTNNLQALQKFATQISAGQKICARTGTDAVLDVQQNFAGQNVSFANEYAVLDFAASCGNACALNVLNHFGAE